ncbi:MAG: hypothetical protein WCK80_02025 [bacterium]|jgi:hypothetical protein
MDDIYNQMIEKIIEQQEDIIGPVAVQRAKLVDELKIDWPKHQISISGSPKTAVDDLVKQYQVLFGQIAVETCKEAVASIINQIPESERPKSLK